MLFNRNKGSFTVEAAIVVSTVIFILCLVIFAAMLLHQKTILEKTAAYAAQQGAELWPDSRKSIDNGEWNAGEEQDDLYHYISTDLLPRNITITFTSQNERDSLLTISQAEEKNGSIEVKKLAKIKSAVLRQLDKSILKAKSTKITIDYKNYFIKRTLEVKIEQEINVPFGFLAQFFNKKSTLTLVSDSISVVAEPAEYIRNVDLGIELAVRLKDSIDINKLIDKIKSNKLEGK